MKQLVFVLFLSCSSVLFSQENSLLFSIKGNGIKTSYIFGTMHVVPDSAFYFPSRIQKIILKTDELVLEIADINNQLKATKLLISTDSSSAFMIFSPAQKDSVLNWGATQTGLTPTLFEQSFSMFHPFVLLQLGTVNLVQGKTRFYEKEIEAIAKENNLLITGLETMEFQISLFMNMNDSTLCEAVMSMIRKPNEQNEQFAEMLRMYQKQNIEGLAQLINDEDDLMGNTDALLNARNQKWIPIISDKIQQKPCFIAVGAGHLGGNNGLLNLLRNEGYTLTPISY